MPSVGLPKQNDFEKLFDLVREARIKVKMFEKKYDLSDPFIEDEAEN
jgi:hypothetical protein